nr:hypothetical protein HK105_000483 [Polyrhizophydium stewartii]
MDRTTDLTDAFVEVKFADFETFRTQICRRTLNPVWNEDFRFEVSDDADLQNEPLELKIMDYDQITYNDAIGTVFIDLNPLLTWDSPAQISGWFPVYDTLLGVRGEVNAQVKLQLFGDINPFKDSSAGVQFFTVSEPPPNYQIVAVRGFVNALDHEDDPEYHWSDNFRTPRKSNEARTRVMFRLSGHIRRQLGKKVLELGGNAVLGFKQHFDLEGETRTITARAIGTAVRIVIREHGDMDHTMSSGSLQSPPFIGPPQQQQQQQAQLQADQLEQQHPQAPQHHDSNVFGSPNIQPILGMGASFSDPSPCPPGADDGDDDDDDEDDDDGGDLERADLPPPLMAQQHVPWRPAEQIPLTLDEFPRGAIRGIGGLVSATSVKVLDNDEREIRSAWWHELRDEIKSHARSLRCPYIAGYTEQVSINEELAILHCMGTAVWLDLSHFSSSSNTAATAAQTSMLGGAYANGSQRLLSTEPSSTPAEGNSSHMLAADLPDISGLSTSPGNSIDQAPSSGFVQPPGSTVSSHVSESPFVVSTPMDSLPRTQKITPSHLLHHHHQHHHYRHQPFHHERGDSGRYRGTPRRGSQASHTRDGESSRRRAKRKLKNLACRASHVTYRRSESPFPMALARCAVCRKKYVPEVLLTTIEPPPELEIIGKGVLIEALVCRQKKMRVGESRAVNTSESIPFAQYDLHRQLMYKLRMHGLNAIFGLRFQISIGENLMTAIATGTAVYVRALPTPPALKVLRTLDVVDEEDEKLMDLQRKIMSQSETNRKRIEEALLAVERREDHPSRSDSDSDSNSSKSDSDDENDSPVGVGGMPSSVQAAASLAAMATPSSAIGPQPSGAVGSRSQQRGVVVQIDDEQDEDLVLFLEETFPDGFELYSVETPPNMQPLMRSLYNFQMVTMIKQAHINSASHHPNRQLASVFRELHQELQYQVGYFSPCIVTGIRYNVQLPKDQGVQVCLQAMVVGALPRLIEGVRAPGFNPSNSSLNLFEQTLLSTRPGSGFADRRISTLQRQGTGTSVASNLDRISVASSLNEDTPYAADNYNEDPTPTDTALAEAILSSQVAAGSSGVGAAGGSGGGSGGLPFSNAGNAINALLGGAASRLGMVTGLVTGAVANMAAGISELSVPNTPTQQRSGSQSLLHPPPLGAIQAPSSFSTQQQQQVQQPFLPTNVELSPNGAIPQSRITRFLGRISLHFIKEANLVFDGLTGNNGMGGFTHMFLAELFAVVKAHTSALGGNAMVGFSMDQTLFSESIKNQGYAFVSVSGDVVDVDYATPPVAPARESGTTPRALVGRAATSGDLAMPAHQRTVSAASLVASPMASGTPVAGASTGAAPGPASMVGMPAALDDFLVVPQSEFATELFQRSWR